MAPMRGLFSKIIAAALTLALVAVVSLGLSGSIDVVHPREEVISAFLMAPGPYPGAGWTWTEPRPTPEQIANCPLPRSGVVADLDKRVEKLKVPTGVLPTTERIRYYTLMRNFGERKAYVQGMLLTPAAMHTADKYDVWRDEPLGGDANVHRTCGDLPYTGSFKERCPIIWIEYDIDADEITSATCAQDRFRVIL